MQVITSPPCTESSFSFVCDEQFNLRLHPASASFASKSFLCTPTPCHVPLATPPTWAPSLFLSGCHLELSQLPSSPSLAQHPALISINNTLISIDYTGVAIWSPHCQEGMKCGECPFCGGQMPPPSSTQQKAP